jgi:trimethylamine---corrinoid protein Co-methyltransferase
MKITLELLDHAGSTRIHEASLEVLSRTGMTFESERLLSGLSRAGAEVDAHRRKARIPPSLVENAISRSRTLLASGKKLHLLNGVTSERGTTEGIEAKVSGGCEQYLDWESQAVKPATARALLRCVRLGELLPEVTFVGNPIVMKEEMDGAPIEERLRRVKTAALIARNTRTVGSMEVWSEKEIDLLVEIGIVARGSRQGFDDHPCLLTAKETISPLFLDRNAGDILLALAERGLPCTVIPMPISGMSAPASPLGSVIVANAEILGVMTAIQSVCPEALVGAGVISGVMDMQSGTASFSALEAILQDIALAEVHGRLYGTDCLIGTGYTNADHPGNRAHAEKMQKFLLSFLAGHTTYPVGLLRSGSVFSPEQALVDLELCRLIHDQFARRLATELLGEIVEVVHEAGIRGDSLGSDFTLRHYREFSPAVRGSDEMYSAAHERCTALLSGRDFWEIESEKAREIDRIVRKAASIL